MLTPEDLKALRLTATDDGFIRDEIGEVAETCPSFPGGALFAASPVLALAVIEARRVITKCVIAYMGAGKERDSHWIDYQNLLAQIDSALEKANVERQS